MRHVRNLRLASYDCQSELNNLCANALTMLAFIRRSVGRTFLSAHKKELATDFNAIRKHHSRSSTDSPIRED